MFCVVTCGLSQRIFLVHLKMYILLPCSEMLCRYQLNLPDLVCHFRSLFPFRFSVWRIYSLISVGYYDPLLCPYCCQSLCLHPSRFSLYIQVLLCQGHKCLKGYTLFFDSSIIMQGPSWSLKTVFVLSLFCHIQVLLPQYFLFILICMKYIFSSPLLLVCILHSEVSLVFLPIQLRCFLIGTQELFNFKVIIDRYVYFAILFF